MSRSPVRNILRTLFRQTRDPLHTPSREPDTRLDPTGGVVEYSPGVDGRADPGEVVWTRVTYEDDPNRGKDRPVLLIGRNGSALLGLLLSSKDHDRDAADEAKYGRYWMDIGSGGWDTERRPSEVRLDRLIEVDEESVRREGAILDRSLFDSVIREARQYHAI